MKIDYDVGDLIVLTEGWGVTVDEVGNQVPQEGMIYTARGFVRDLVSGELGVWLREIVNPKRPTAPAGQMSEMAWAAHNFRKVRTPSIEPLMELADAARQ